MPGKRILLVEDDSLIRELFGHVLYDEGYAVDIAATAAERTNCRIKDFRGIATRYDKLARNFLAGLCLVTALLYWCD
jgi:transposase